MSSREKLGAFVQRFANAVFAQALLSLGSLLVSLILLRYGSDVQYGYYVLVLNAVLLVTQVQGSFVGPAMVNEMRGMPPAERSKLIGGLYRGQRRSLPPLVGICVVGACALWFFNVLDMTTGPLVLVGILAGWAALRREFFRMVLYAYRLSGPVLLGDAVYVLLLVGGARIASLAPASASVAVVFLCAAALIAGTMFARSLWKHESWNEDDVPEIWRKIARVGAWTTAGAVVHWTFSQGYSYLVVGTLDVAAVAAAASTRMVMMPVNLLSSGIGSLMLPTANAWLLEHGANSTFRRLTVSATVISAAALLYLIILWFARDFIFTRILHKHFAQLDLLLILWSAASLMMVVRDQVMHFLLARARYRSLTLLTMVCAVSALTVSYLSMLRIGVAGAPLGVLTGEVINVVGMVVMSRMDLQRDELHRTAA